MSDSSVMITPIFDQLVAEFQQRGDSTPPVGQNETPKEAEVADNR
jgi:hypothetical protein